MKRETSDGLSLGGTEQTGEDGRTGLFGWMGGGRTATFGLQSLGRTGNFVWKRPGRTDIFRRIKSSLGCDIRLANYPQTNLAAIGTGAPFHSKMQQFQPHDTERGKRRRGEKTKRNGQDDAQLAAVSKEEGATLHTFSHFYCLFCLEEGEMKPGQR